MGKGTGFGKAILIGDQFVLYGVPAIVSALPYETVAEVKRFEGEGWLLDDQRREVPGYKHGKKHQQTESINRILKVMGIDVKRHPIQITLSGSLLAGSGVGASAAGCVALARALNEEFQLGLNTEQINHVAWEGEFAYHGLPSGVDNTASTYGGLLFYEVRGEQKLFEKIHLAFSCEIVLANTGVTADTARLRSLTEDRRQKNPAAFSRLLELLKGQVLEVREALEGGNLEKVGKIMTKNHEILISLGLSHPKLIELCDLALQQGALGAKLTGGGMGGYMIALTPGPQLQEIVASAIEGKGYPVIRASLGNV